MIDDRSEEEVNELPPTGLTSLAEQVQHTMDSVRDELGMKFISRGTGTGKTRSEEQGSAARPSSLQRHARQRAVDPARRLDSEEDDEQRRKRRKQKKKAKKKKQHKEAMKKATKKRKKEDEERRRSAKGDDNPRAE